MTPKEKQQRARYTRQLHIAILSRVYDRQIRQQQIAMSALAIRNQEIHKHLTASFIFEGKWYTDIPGESLPTKSYDMDRVLDISLRETARKILHEENEEDKAHITGYIGHVLSVSRTVTCLKKLLPSKLWNNQWLELSDLWDIGDPLTQEEIDTFNSINGNQKGIRALKILFMEDLIMAKVE